MRTKQEGRLFRVGKTTMEVKFGAKDRGWDWGNGMGGDLGVEV